MFSGYSSDILKISGLSLNPNLSTWTFSADAFKISMLRMQSNTIFNIFFMSQSLQRDNSKDKLVKNQSLLGSFRNMLTKDLNKIAKKLPLPPVLGFKKKKKEFDRNKFIKILEKKQRYYSKLLFELSDLEKIENCRILLSSLNLLFLNQNSINDDEILEMYAKIKKGL